MIRIYLKQAWTLMKQNRLFTTIYVGGTGLSIALTMTLFIIFYVKMAPIYPEYNRDRTMVIKGIKRSPKNNPESWSINGGSSYYIAKEMLPSLPHAEVVGAALSGIGQMETFTISLPGREEAEALLTYADAGFWRVFTFDFVQGAPFAEEDVEGNVPVAVVSRSTAMRLFASTDVVGRHFLLDGHDFRVCGVVEDVSNATPDTAGDLWVPLFHCRWTEYDRSGTDLTGSTACYILAKDGDTEALKAEVEESFRKHNLQNTRYDHDLLGQPYVYWQNSLRTANTEPLDLWKATRFFLYMLLALLFIPALNLSGMISSRMDGRLSELGVRKAYGATNGQLVRQVLFENLFLTCAGGVFGLLIAYLIVYTSSDWILYLFDEWVWNSHGVSLQPEMLFNPTLFALTFGLCILLNLISAYIPAALALRRSIISSIHAKL